MSLTIFMNVKSVAVAVAVASQSFRKKENWRPAYINQLIYRDVESDFQPFS